MKKEQQFKELTSELKKLASNTESIDDIIKLARCYGSICWANSTGVFEDPSWEQLLTKLLYKKHNNRLNNYTQNENELHIVSACLSSGGHTRLLENIIKIRGTGDILISRKEPFYKDKLSVNDNVNVFSFTNSDASVDNIVSIGQKYKTIFLHINPDDIVSVVAVGILKKSLNNNIKIIFVNHADHVFSFGFEFIDAIAEISLFGFNINKNHRANKGCKSFFMGIPLEYKNILPAKPSNDSSLNIFSGGSDYKYKPYKQYNFQYFIKKLEDSLQEYTFTIVGAESKQEYWNSLKGMVHIKLFKTLPYNDYLSLMSSANLCIDSFPVTGGTAFPNAWMKGKLVTGLSIPMKGYTILDGLKFSTIDELIEAIMELSQNKENSGIYKLNSSKKLEKLFALNHSFESVGERLNKGLKSNENIFEYFIDYDLSENDSLFFYKMWKDDDQAINLPIDLDFLARYMIKANKSDALSLLITDKTKKVIVSIISEELQHLQKEKDLLDNELTSHKKQINKIYLSFSWGITKPLRIFGRIYNKLLNK